MNRWGAAKSAGIGVLTALLFVLASDLELSKTVESRTLDTRFRLSGARSATSPLAIVFIGDDSIEAFGRWPWSWEYHALLVDVLARAGARRIFFDILFTEKPADGTAPLFAGMAARAKNVYFSSYFDNVEPGRGGAAPFPSGRALKTPVPELRRIAAGLGHCNTQPDSDGSVRRLPLIIRHEGGLYPAAPLLLATEMLGIPLSAAALSRDGRHLELTLASGATASVPVDAGGQTPVNYFGGLESFSAYSFRQVLQADQHPDRAVIPLDVFKDKTVLVGATFAGNAALRPTPFSNAFPMTVVHATMLENLLTADFIHTPSRPVVLALWILLGGGVGVVTFLFRPLVSLALSAAAGSAYLAGTIAGFSWYRWNVELVGPLLTIAATYTIVTAVRYFSVDRDARTIRTMFSSYLTERVVKELIAHPELAALGGERREVTVLFADIWGFTTFSEKHTAEEVVARLNEILDVMTLAIIRWEGTLDKFIGDAIVAFWGAPLQQPDHAKRAVRCALDMSRRLDDLQRRWELEGRERLEMGIGINTGEVIVGNIGSAAGRWTTR